MELASAIGNGRKITEFTMAKSAALAAMQTANVSSTVSANPLSRHKERTAYFRSRKSVSMTCAPLLSFSRSTAAVDYIAGADWCLGVNTPSGNHTQVPKAKFRQGMWSLKRSNTLSWTRSAARGNSSIPAISRTTSCVAEAAVPIKLPGTKSRRAGKGSRPPGRTRAFPQFRA